MPYRGFVTPTSRSALSGRVYQIRDTDREVGVTAWKSKLEVGVAVWISDREASVTVQCLKSAQNPKD